MSAAQRARRGRGSGKKLAASPKRLACYRLALALGWFNVDAMLATGTPRQLAEWEEYYQLEPYGQDWSRSSIVAARTINTILAVAPTKNEQDKEFYDDDAFVPKRKDDTKQRAEIKAQCDAADSIEGFGV